MTTSRRAGMRRTTALVWEQVNRGKTQGTPGIWAISSVSSGRSMRRERSNGLAAMSRRRSSCGCREVPHAAARARADD